MMTADRQDNPNGDNTPLNSENCTTDDSNKMGENITVPGISNDETIKEKTDETSSPREGKHNLRPNPTPKLLLNASQKC